VFTVPCWTAVPSLNAAEYPYEVAPTAAPHVTAYVTPVASDDVWFTAGDPGGSGGPAAVRSKVTVTVDAAFTITTHAPVPVQAPLQLVKFEPAAGVAVSVTAVPGVTDCEQVVPQLMPAGLLVTVPVPVPFFVTVSVTGVAVNAAVTEVSALTVTTHVPVPVQAPLQPANAEPVAGAAVRVTAVPAVKDFEQVVPQLIPAGLLVTVPEPVPLFVTESVVPPVAEPLTATEIVSPLAVKFTLLAKVPAAVGAKRTVTVWLAPEARVKDAPDTML